MPQKGLLEPGNIDLYKQPEVKNSDGTTSTVDSSSYNIDGKEVLLPSVTLDGRHLKTSDEIIKEYQKTGRHLGKFDTPENATSYATQLHNDYAAGKYKKMPDPQNKDWFSQFEEDKGKDYFSQFEEVPSNVKETQKEEPSLLSRAWNAISEPPKIVTDTANKVADYIDNPQGEGGYLRGFGAGAIQGASNLLTPLNAVTTLLPESRLAKIFSGAQLAEGASEIGKGHYLQGAADIGMGALGLKGIVRERPNLPKEEIPLKEAIPVPDIPVPSPTRQRLLPQGQYNVSPFGEAGVPLNEGFEQASSPLTLTPKKQKLLGEGSRFIASPEGEVSDIAVPLEEPPIRHEPTNAEGQVTVKEDAKLEPQIKEGEVVSEVPKPEVLKTPEEEVIPEVKLRGPAQEYIDGIKSGSIDKGTSYTSYLSGKTSLMSRLIKEDKGTFEPAKLFKGKDYPPDRPGTRTNQNPDWVETESDARKLGINPKDFPNIDDLKWEITRKTAQETVRTGKNPLLKRLIQDESGEFSPFKMFKKIRGVDDAEANKVRESIVNSLIQGGRLDLEGIYGKTVGMNRNQFNKIVDEIIDTGAASKIAEQIKINTPQPIQRLLGALADSKINSALQAAQLSAERGQRFGAFSSALGKGEGKEGFRKAASQMAGEYSKVSPVEFKLGQADTDALYNQIKNNTRITPAEKLRAGFALRDLLEGNRVLQRNELQLMDRIYGPGIGNQIMELHGGLGGVPFKLAKTANTMKSMNATFDLSAPFRQGLGLVHRREYWTAFGQMFKYVKSEEAFQALEKSMEAHPNYLLSRDAGLFTADHSIGNFEEAWMDSYLNDIHKAIGEKNTAKYSPARASERAYVGFLNKLRFDTFNTLLENAENAGLKTYNMKEGIKIPTDLTNQIAKYVNTATGRGDLGSLSKYADGLNNILFSPRLIASRLTILNPMYYVNANPFVRKEALKTLLALGTFTGTVGAIGSVMGGETKLTPTSKNLTNPDFGKLKFGKTRLDPGGGLNQYIVAANQFVQGKATSSTSQRTYDLSGPRTMYAGQKPVFGQQSVGGKIGGVFQQNPSFLENKFSPMASLIDTLLTGRSNASGQPINIKTEIAKKFTPLIMQDLYDLYQEDPKLLGLGVPAAFGMGLQTYQEREPSMGMSAPKMNLNLKP